MSNTFSHNTSVPLEQLSLKQLSLEELSLEELSLRKIEYTFAPSTAIYDRRDLSDLLAKATTPIYAEENIYLPFKSTGYLVDAEKFFNTIDNLPPIKPEDVVPGYKIHAIPSNDMYAGVSATGNTTKGPVTFTLNQFTPIIGTSKKPIFDIPEACYPDLHIPIEDYRSFLANSDKDGGFMPARSHVVTAPKGKWLHGTVLGHSLYIITITCSGFRDKDGSVIQGSEDCGYTVSIELNGVAHIGYLTFEPLEQNALDVGMIIEEDGHLRCLVLTKGNDQDGQGRDVITGGETLTPGDKTRIDKVRRTIEEEMGTVPTKSYLLPGGTFKNNAVSSDPRYTIYKTYVEKLGGFVYFGVRRKTTTDLEIVYTTVEATKDMGACTDQKEIAGRKWVKYSELPTLLFWMDFHRQFITVMKREIDRFKSLTPEEQSEFFWDLTMP